MDSVLSRANERNLLAKLSDVGKAKKTDNTKSLLDNTQNDQYQLQWQDKLAGIINDTNTGCVGVLYDDPKKELLIFDQKSYLTRNKDTFAHNFIKELLKYSYDKRDSSQLEKLVNRNNRTLVLTEEIHNNIDKIALYCAENDSLQDMLEDIKKLKIPLDQNLNEASVISLVSKCKYLVDTHLKNFVKQQETQDYIEKLQAILDNYKPHNEEYIDKIFQQITVIQQNKFPEEIFNKVNVLISLCKHIEFDLRDKGQEPDHAFKALQNGLAEHVTNRVFEIGLKMKQLETHYHQMQQKMQNDRNLLNELTNDQNALQALKNCQKVNYPNKDLSGKQDVHPDVKAMEYLRSTRKLEQEGSYYIGLTIPPCVPCDISIKAINKENAEKGQIACRPTEGRYFPGWHRFSELDNTKVNKQSLEYFQAELDQCINNPESYLAYRADHTIGTTKQVKNTTVPSLIKTKDDNQENRILNDEYSEQEFIDLLRSASQDKLLILNNIKDLTECLQKTDQDLKEYDIILHVGAIHNNMANKAKNAKQQNHWVGLKVNKLGKSTQVQFIDPLGYPPSDEIKEAIKTQKPYYEFSNLFEHTKAHPQHANVQIVQVGKEVLKYIDEGDDKNCGAMLIDVMKRLEKGDTKEDIQKDIKNIKDIDASIKHGKKLRAQHAKEALVNNLRLDSQQQEKKNTDDISTGFDTTSSNTTIVHDNDQYVQEFRDRPTQKSENTRLSAASDDNQLRKQLAQYTNHLDKLHQQLDQFELQHKKEIDQHTQNILSAEKKRTDSYNKMILWKEHAKYLNTYKQHELLKASKNKQERQKATEFLLYNSPPRYESAEIKNNIDICQKEIDTDNTNIEESKKYTNSVRESIEKYKEQNIAPVQNTIKEIENNLGLSSV